MVGGSEVSEKFLIHFRKVFGEKGEIPLCTRVFFTGNGPKVAQVKIKGRWVKPTLLLSFMINTQFDLDNICTLIIITWETNKKGGLYGSKKQ